MPFNFPLILTLIRLVLSPILLPYFIVHFGSSDNVFINFCLVSFFIFLSLTDFFDGYLARKYGQSTKLGKILDPIADKLLLMSSIISLVYLNRMFYYFGVIFLSRELVITSLRLSAANYGFNLNVLSSAKYKTFFQMTYLAFLIFSLNKKTSLSIFNVWNFIEYILFAFALFFTIFSAVEYVRMFQRKIREKNDFS